MFQCFKEKFILGTEHPTSPQLIKVAILSLCGALDSLHATERGYDARQILNTNSHACGTVSLTKLDTVSPRITPRAGCIDF